MTDQRAGQTLIVPDVERGTLVVTGPERLDWLNGILSCEVASLEPGRGRFGLALTKQGKIQSDVHVVATDERVLLSVAPTTAADLCERFEQLLIMEDAEIADASAAFAWIYLHGPRAVELAENASGVRADLDLTGLGGAVIAVDRAELDQVVARLAERSGGEAVVDDGSAWRALRIERALPVFGVDYALGDNPHEAGLERRAVSWTKGCYLGQEVVCMQDMRGKVKRRLTPLVLEAAEVAAGAEVRADGAPVGQLTSVAFSSRLGQTIALASLKAPHFEGKAPLAVAERPARVLPIEEPPPAGAAPPAGG